MVSFSSRAPPPATSCRENSETVGSSQPCPCWGPIRSCWRSVFGVWSRSKSSDCLCACSRRTAPCSMSSSTTASQSSSPTEKWCSPSAETPTSCGCPSLRKHSRRYTADTNHSSVCPFVQYMPLNIAFRHEECAVVIF